MENENAAPEAAESASDAVARAFEGFDADEAVQETPEAVPDAGAPEPEAPSGPARDEMGRFTRQEQEASPEPPAPADLIEAPTRFSADAKAEWATAPKSVQHEIRRAIEEMEAGLNGYQQDYGDLKDYAELAKGQGTTIKEALDRYVGIERMLQEDPVKGLEQICQNMGTTLQDIVSKVSGTPENETIAQLNAKIAQLENQFGGVQQNIQQQREGEIQARVTAFAETHERFNELSDDIAKLLQTGYAADLESAYDIAARLKPVAKPEPQAAQAAKALSVSGAPDTGSNPATRKPPSSARDAVEQAFARLG